MVDYSKWKDIEVSDDEDDTHPNIDTPSLFRWRHQARVERMAELEAQKKEVESKKKEIESKKKQTAAISSGAVDESTKKALEELQIQEKTVKEEEEALKKKERLMPWNVDTLSKEGFTKTVINKPKPKQDLSKLSEEERHELYKKFINENEAKIKKYGMMAKWDDCKAFLLEYPHLTCEDTANYLAFWCLNLEMEEKHDLMNHVAKQVVAMQYILELSKQLDCDPRSCISSFFTRIQRVDKEYQDAFEDELNAFRQRIRKRAQEKLAKIMEEIEEEERQKRLGPGGLDPAEVYESLPKELQECFDSRDIAKLQQVIDALPKDEAELHMRRCVDSGLWIPDARAAGLTPASEEAAAAGSDEPVYDELEKKEG